MQTLTITVQDDVIDKVLAMLKKFSTSEVQVIQLPIEKDIFEQTSGILQSRKIDPVTWQRNTRSEDWE